ncbi:MoaD/ThiS family protein [Hoyosella altamirensis]|uniref:Molybdopterin synthase sulfur carrier subunit n=1 Tax=Hoyosella altamirensis TaxID=616997 RepID=A0A839RU00_9ACTN|nr:MoaD/ThiS family protein [Hoyosella altamirensis]MBB3039373.1 molybdopterin converting factor small subunit [Hoyosella altamirensis]
MTITVRYFAAASRAAGTPEETCTIEPGSTLAQLIASLSDRNAELARVLGKCQFLIDETAVTDTSIEITEGNTVDVLPPFAGG